MRQCVLNLLLKRPVPGLEFHKVLLDGHLEWASSISWSPETAPSLTGRSGRVDKPLHCVAANPLFSFTFATALGRPRRRGVTSDWNRGQDVCGKPLTAQDFQTIRRK
jgi:hypothetical protein